MKELKKAKVSKKMLDAVGNMVLSPNPNEAGISEEEVPVFLNPDLYTPTAPEEFPGMEEAVKIVRRAIKQGRNLHLQRLRCRWSHRYRPIVRC